MNGSGWARAVLLSCLSLLAGCGTTPATAHHTTAVSTQHVPKHVVRKCARRHAPSHRRAAVASCTIRSQHVSWRLVSGHCYKGYASGMGVARSVDGRRRYQGHFVRGWFEGKGRYDWGNGVVYTGEFMHGVRTGQGTIVYADHSSYHGSFRNGLYDGNGRYVDANGAQYQGEFRAGKFNGQGRYRWANGDRYEGRFRENLMDGPGIYVRSNGERYQGMFHANERSGIGSYIWPNGDSYVGHFARDRIDGKGVYTDTKGNRCVGIFSEGRIEHATCSNGNSPLPVASGRRMGLALPETGNSAHSRAPDSETALPPLPTSRTAP